MDLISLLVNLIVIACIFGVAIWLIGWVSPPAPFLLPIKAIVALILFLWLIGTFTGYAPGPSHLFWKR